MARDERRRKKPRLPPPSLTSSSPPSRLEQRSEDHKKTKRKNRKHSKKEGQEEARTQEIYDDDNDNEVEKTGEEKKKKKKKGLITDPRFAAAHYDPRFQRMPKRESKVVIDSRFARIFSDKSFESSSAPVDKRGKRKKAKAVNPLLHYYLQQEDKEEEEGQLAGLKETSAEVEPERDVSAEDDEDSGNEDDDMEEQSPASTSDENSSTDDEDFDDDESVKSELYKYLLANHEDTPVTDTETHRLAVVNMDWNHIKAVDLYVVMSSCLPKDGQILSVTIYPSEFGLKCMETEATRGPFALFSENDEDSGEDSDIDHEKLRSYELNKLRYYYAVVVCDSIATASHVYKTLDGTELLETSNVFDLRYIPDSMEFKHPPRDVATEAPVTYKEPDFQTCALQHTKVKLTWEDDEPERKKILRRKFNLDQLDELNIYLASSDDSDEDDGNDEDNNDAVKKRKGVEELRSLLLSGNDSDGEKNDEKDMDKDMEITFNTELEDLSKRILEKKDKKSETVWETVLRKRSEKKKERKRSKRSDDDSSDDDEEAPDQTDDFFVEEPIDTENKVGNKKSKSSSKKRRKDDKDNNDLLDLDKEQEASRAELELLLADEQGPSNGPKGYNMKKNKKVKDKKGKEVAIEDKLPDIDIHSDPRFSALFTSHLFALDPTDPQYKRSAAFMRERATMKQKKGAKEADIPPQEAALNTLERENDAVSGNAAASAVVDEKNDFLSTVRSLKRNVGSFRNQSKGRKN